MAPYGRWADQRVMRMGESQELARIEGLTVPTLLVVEVFADSPVLWTYDVGLTTFCYQREQRAVQEMFEVLATSLRIRAQVVEPINAPEKAAGEVTVRAAIGLTGVVVL